MSDDPNGAIEPTTGDAAISPPNPYDAVAAQLFQRNVGPGNDDYGRNPPTLLRVPQAGGPADSSCYSGVVVDAEKNVDLLLAELGALRKIKAAAKNVTENYRLGCLATGRHYDEDFRALCKLLEEPK